MWASPAPGGICDRHRRIAPDGPQCAAYPPATGMRRGPFGNPGAPAPALPAAGAAGDAAPVRATHGPSPCCTGGGSRISSGVAPAPARR